MTLRNVMTEESAAAVVRIIVVVELKLTILGGEQ
jgi:hypothetical protein